MNPIQTINAVAYKSLSGKRFFTKLAALKSSAWFLWRKKYPCECGPSDPYDDSGKFCPRHGNERALSVIERLVDKWQKARGGKV